MTEHQDQLTYLAARTYAERGWAIAPAHGIRADSGACTCGEITCGKNSGKHPRTAHSFYDATTDLTIIDAWFDPSHPGYLPNSNILIATGSVSGITVMDIDPRHDGEQSLNDLELEASLHGVDLTTRSVITGSGGSHLFYAYPELDSSIPSRIGLFPGIDVKSDGGYVVAPPSTHLSGRTYTWTDTTTAIAPLSDFLLELITNAPNLGGGTGGPLSHSSDLGAILRGEARIPLGSRDNVFYALASRLRGANVPELEAMERLGKIWELQTDQDPDDPYPAEQVARKVALAYAKYEPNAALELAEGSAKWARSFNSDQGPQQEADENHPTRSSLTPGGLWDGYEGATDTARANGRRVAFRYQRFLRCFQYSRDTTWYRCQDGLWIPDHNAARKYASRNLEPTIRREAEQAADEDDQKRYMEWAKVSASAGAPKAAADYAADDALVLVENMPAGEYFDANPDQIAFPNGVVDLRTGDFRSLTPEDLVSRTCTVEYDPRLVDQCPRWFDFLELILPDPAVRDYVRLMLGMSLLGADKNHEFFILDGAGANGKLLSLDTPLPTPSGWTSMGEVEVGDEVFGTDGSAHTVLAASDIEIPECYKLTFSDGSEIVAGADHLWDFEDTKSRTRKRQVMRTADIEVFSRTRPADLKRNRRSFSEARWRLPQFAALKIPETQLPIPPYTLGAWLGDGTSASTGFTSALDDAEIRNRIRDEGWVVHQLSGTKNWSIHGNRGVFLGLLRDAGILNNKHIPAIYFRASYDQRLELLRGLLDTDGTVSKTGTEKKGRQVEFCSTNRELAFGTAALVRTFGITTTVREGRATLYGKDCGPKYRVMFTTGLPVFGLARKEFGIQQWAGKGHGRTLRSVERVADVPCRCIQTSAPDHLYLAGDGMVPTHNSTLLTAVTSVLGLYAMPVPKTVFVQRRDDAHPADTADLEGLRFATNGTELKENDHLNEDLLKSIVSLEPFRTRKMHQDFWTLKPRCTLWLSTNVLPELKDVGIAMQRRLRRIRFEVTIPPPYDPLFAQKLVEAEGPAILATLVADCQRFLAVRNELVPPEAVRLETADYLQEEDPFAVFVNECLNSAPSDAGPADSWVPVSNLYQCYNDWCTMNGQMAKSPIWFGRSIGRFFPRGRPTIPGTGQVRAVRCYVHHWPMPEAFDIPTSSL